MTTVGLFGGPYRLSWSLRIIPQTLSLPLYPLYSLTAHFSPSRFGDVYRQSLKFLLFFSIPFAAFFIAWSKPTSDSLALGVKFLPALPAMELLGLGLIPFFISTFFNISLPLWMRRRGFFVGHYFGSGLRILSSLSLIYNSYVGPAIAFVCCRDH